jgi:hypothetical protein
MTVLFKLIIRFDFPPIFQVLDKKGVCFSILTKVPEGFWQTFGDGLNPHIRLMHEHPVGLNVVYKTGTQR